MSGACVTSEGLIIAPLSLQPDSCPLSSWFRDSETALCVVTALSLWGTAVQ